MKEETHAIVREPCTVSEMQQCLDLRFRILREPIGLPRGSEVAVPLIYEIAGFHLMAILPNEQQIVGTALGVVEGDVANVCALAVEKSYQSNGIGKALIEKLEKKCIERGVKTIHVLARQKASHFYEKLGFHIHRVLSPEESRQITQADLLLVEMDKRLLQTKL